MKISGHKTIIIPVSYCYPFFDNSASERFRCDWLLPYLPADKYDGTQDLNNYDVIIYQKAHSGDMVEISKKHKDKIQIFDTTDPEFLFSEGKYFHDIMLNMTFVVVSTNGLKDGFERYEFKKMYKPIYVVPDRHEFDYYKIKKVHSDKKPVFIWFGYAVNFERIRPLLSMIEGYELIVICEEPVGHGKFVPWKLETANEEIIKGDIVLNLPDEYSFKSNNKTTTAWALNMPVVEKSSDLLKFLDYKERIKESDYRYRFVREKYDIRRSADELNNLITKYLKV